MLYIDQYVYTNKIRAAHPLERFAFAITTMLIGMLAANPAVKLTIIAIMLGLLIFKAKIPGLVVLKLMLIPLGFLLIGLVGIAVAINPNELGMLASVQVGNAHWGVTENSLRIAGNTMLTSLSAVTALYFLVLTIPMIDFIYVLRLLRMPTIVLELMMLMYRFIFVFLNTAFYIYTSQSARLGYSGFRRSINSFGILFANLWGKAFVKSQALFTSLLSRGYDKDLKVLHPEYSYSARNILVFMIIDLSLIGLALA